jgi:hypothetical protein
MLSNDNSHVPDSLSTFRTTIAEIDAAARVDDPHISLSHHHRQLSHHRFAAKTGPIIRT